VFTATSGSTGEPFYFPRTYRIDWQASVIHELFFRQSQVSLDGPTLVMVCFGMGVWIGGLITYQSFEIMREHGHPISIITPGINKIEIFKALKRLAPHYKQVIMIGYAPFLKDVLDEGPMYGVSFKKLNARFIFAAEAFTERFRDYLTKKATIRNERLDTMNIYGSADVGAMAFETPASILIRQIAMKKHRLFAELFHQIQRTPTLAQYVPSFITFEEENGGLFLTGDNVVPLVRYDIGDHGGIFTWSEILEKCKIHATDLQKEIRAARLGEFVYKLPFVYVYERADLSTTLYGLQIYPETVREVLIERPMNKFLTGKLTLITRFDRNQNQYLEVNLECKKGKKINPRIKHITLAQITSNLRLKNSEFRELYNSLGNRVLPRLVFWPSEHPLYFKPGIKQKWVKK
jgi:phenylacetate-CoA ligase